METWKDIEGYEGYYQVSDYGRIKSVDRKITRKDGEIKNLKGKLLKQGYKQFGYCFVSLYKDHDCIAYYVHRLVAKAFIKNVFNKHNINHIDNNPKNNHISNLEWCTQSENLIHAYKNGYKDPVSLKGINNPWSKLTEEAVKDIYLNYDRFKKPRKFFSKKYSVSTTTISAVLNGQNWSWLTSTMKIEGD